MGRGGAVRQAEPQDRLRAPPAPRRRDQRLGVRRRHGAEVLAVQTVTGAVFHPPDPGRPLAAGDVLLVVRAAAACVPPDG